MRSAVIPARKLALLMILRAPDSKGRSARPISGITRLQMLLFLVWTKVGRVSQSREINIDFDYHPQRYGPADTGLYADLEFLVALGHISRSRTPGDVGLHVDRPGSAQLNFDDLFVSEPRESGERSDDLSLEELSAAAVARNRRRTPLLQMLN